MERVGSIQHRAFRGPALVGWEFVEYHMQRQLERGLTTPEAWADELQGEPYEAIVLADPTDLTSKMVPICEVYPSKEKNPRGPIWGRSAFPKRYASPRRMESWNFYLWWKDEHPGQEVPKWVKTMWDDGEFAEICAKGYAAILAPVRARFLCSESVGGQH